VAIRWIIAPITIIDLPAGTDLGPDPETGLPRILSVRFRKLHVEVRDNLHARVETRARTPNEKWALLQVMTHDAASEITLSDKPNTTRLFEDDEEPEWDWGGRSLKDRSFRAKNWNQGRLNQWGSFLRTRGITDPGFTLDTPLDEVMAFLIEQFNAGTVI